MKIYEPQLPRTPLRVSRLACPGYQQMRLVYICKIYNQSNDSTNGEFLGWTFECKWCGEEFETNARDFVLALHRID